MCDIPVGYQSDKGSLLMTTENPSTQAPHEPVTPTILNPLGGTSVWLYGSIIDQHGFLSGKKEQKRFAGRTTYPEPPLGLPYIGDFLPELVNI